MLLAKGQFPILYLFRLSQPFSEQWVTRESQKGSVGSTSVSTVL